MGLTVVQTSSEQAVSPSQGKFPEQRWQIAPEMPEAVAAIADAVQLSPLLAQVLVNRGMTTPEAAQVFLNPEFQELPSPLEDFADLPLALELLINAINQRQKVAICGDYDADGMTSTALLLRALRSLGGRVDYAIPSRMAEGYGLNQRIVEEFYDDGVALILTVDNGIAAHAPIQRARELGISVIITDHHDIPPQLPPAHAILNPKLIPETSPYRGLAGVGVAYILADWLAKSCGNPKGLGDSLLELFTLGTIADLAPLIGVNRCWVRRGLERLPQSQLAGVQALIQVCGLGSSQSLKPEAIGFRLGPRINAVGRLADPQIVIELLTTDDPGVALERAMQCEQINEQRRQLCNQIEQEAIALCDQDPGAVQRDRVLVPVQAGWHHGVIGIVASRLVERYGVPVFIGTYEDEQHKQIRGSARSIPEFHVFEALEFAKPLLEKYGGHRAAGGFSLRSGNFNAFCLELQTFAHACLRPEHLKPLVTVDVQADLAQIDFNLFQQIDRLHPCGMENPDPVFWTPNVRILEQRLMGKGHLRLTIAQSSPGLNGNSRRFQALAWRWGEYYPLPDRLDLAYRLRTNDWQGEVSLELELVGVRLPSPTPAIEADERQSAMPQSTVRQGEFLQGDRKYVCTLTQEHGRSQLRILNPAGKVLIVHQGDRTGTLITEVRGHSDRKTVNVCQPPYYPLIKAALEALDLGKIQ